MDGLVVEAHVPVFHSVGDSHGNSVRLRVKIPSLNGVIIKADFFGWGSDSIDCQRSCVPPWLEGVLFDVA